MRRLARWLVPLLFALGLLAGREWLFPRKPLEVKVFRAARGEVRETVASPSAGTVVSRREATVAAEAPGRVTALRVRAGDRVAEGAPIVDLDARDAELDLEAAKASFDRQRAALDQARAKYAKAKEDWERARTSRSIFSEDQVRAFEVAHEVAAGEAAWAERAVTEAEIAVKRARVALEKRSVRAPFAGIVRRTLIEVGEFVGVGTPCFEMFDDVHIYVKAPIDEVDLPRVRVGAPVEVTLQSFPDAVFPGKVSKIEPGVRASQELNRTGEVEIDLFEGGREAGAGAAYAPAPQIRVGMSADLEVIVQSKPQALRVPSYAVHEEERVRFVYVVEEGKIARREVKIGLANWDHAEIVEGLSPGDPVVVSLDLDGLAAGAPARIAGEVSEQAIARP
jgi:HlyD family secretion protein